MSTTTVDIATSGDVVVGIDTHKYVHVGVVFDTIAGLLSTISIPADSDGCAQLLSWAEPFGHPIAFVIEGTGSYGGALTSFIRRRGHASSKLRDRIDGYAGWSGNRTRSTPRMQRKQ